MTKDRLSPLDASFLRLEDATSHMHMHMAAALIFAGKSPSYGRLLARVESRVGLVPRYRQRIAEVPLAQARSGASQSPLRQSGTASMTSRSCFSATREILASASGAESGTSRIASTVAVIVLTSSPATI